MTQFDKGYNQALDDMKDWFEKQKVKFESHSGWKTDPQLWRDIQEAGLKWGTGMLDNFLRVLKGKKK